MAIPTAPHTIDTTAPIKKAIAVKRPSAVNIQMTPNITALKSKQIRYSCLRNYLAPWMETKVLQKSWFQVPREFPFDGSLPHEDSCLHSDSQPSHWHFWLFCSWWWPRSILTLSRRSPNLHLNPTWVVLYKTMTFLYLYNPSWHQNTNVFTIQKRFKKYGFGSRRKSPLSISWFVYFWFFQKLFYFSLSTKNFQNIKIIV